MRTVEVAGISQRGGGGAYRASKLLYHRSLHGVECYSVLLGARMDVPRLPTIECRPIGRAYFKPTLGSKPFLPRRWLELTSPIEVVIHDRFNTKDVDVVIGHHETIECIRATLAVSSIFNAKRALILQLPPLYGNSTRRRKIEDAYMLYLDMIKSCGDGVGYALRLLRKEADDIIEGPFTKALLSLLSRFDVVLAVSRSIEVDMGFTLNNMVALKCGIGFDVDEISFLRGLRTKGLCGPKTKRGRYAIYSARLDASKGVVEALLAARHIKKSLPNFRLIITGSGTERTLAMVNRFIKCLGLESNVLLTGFLPRAEALELKGGARIVIYPSHVDAYPYSVAESLIMGTPVVGYRIPALTLNYGGVAGLYLVEEGDVEALAQGVLEVFEMKKVEVGEPRIYTFDDVVAEEIEILRRLVG